ncbi:MAG: 30S ribosomal protein S4 [Peptostreptococcaceae bacterium]|nr:30S ribosomal protein S4 [Peptostreptococcaceae bacterium]
MARPSGPRFKVARRFGVNIYDHPKALKRGPKPTKKVTEYGKQLNEKQKLKAYYDVLERQFSNLVAAAMHAKGNSGEILIQRLECRLDNLTYRLGFGASLRQARQMVVHGHILVNGKRVDRPSFEVRVGDVISLKEKSQSVQMFKDNFEARNNFLPYLEKDVTAMKGKLVALPKRDEVPIEVTDSLIIEYYSK